MPRTYRVHLDIYRGARSYPIGRRTLQVTADSALGAAVRAEELVNVLVADNEYAAVGAVLPQSPRRRTQARKALPFPATEPVAELAA